MEAFVSLLQEQWQQQSMLEVVAVIFSLLYPLLAARQNILCWPCALISTGLYVHLFWEVSLPFQSLLNGYYLLMAVYGWIKWRKGADEDALSVTQWPIWYHVIAIPVLLITSFAISHLVSFSWLSSDLYLDALVTVFSVYTTYLMANKILENWLFWIVINSFAAYLYFNNSLMLTGVMFIWYVGMAIYGYKVWLNDYRDSESALVEQKLST